MREHHFKDYGKGVRLVLTVCSTTKTVLQAEVLYKDSAIRTFIKLGYIMGNKTVLSQECYSGSDWELFESLSFATSEAFYAHGEYFDSLLIDGVRKGSGK